MGLGSFDTDAGAQPSGIRSRAPFSAAGLAGGVVAHNSAAVDLTAPSAFETNTLVASALATDGALLLTPSNALSDYAPSAVAAELPSVSRPTLIITRRLTGYERFAKPVIDRVLALVLLIALSPLLLAVGVLVAVSLGWPIVLRQRRIGRNGEPFVLHKFRSMHPDRRQVVATYHGTDRRVTHKHPDDPRLTLVGRTIRKWSLDELPQLWDVLTGKLSLVGPRPELESIVADYEPWQHARHAVKPGLTGLWQVKARGDGEMHEHTDLDIEYVGNVTFGSDLKITLLTLPAILARKGY